MTAAWISWRHWKKLASLIEQKYDEIYASGTMDRVMLGIVGMIEIPVCRSILVNLENQASKCDTIFIKKIGEGRTGT